MWLFLPAYGLESKSVSRSLLSCLVSPDFSPLLFQVTVLFAGQNIDRSPFDVNVGMALGDASKVTARGPGLEPVGNVANKPTYFDIYTAGKGRLNRVGQTGRGHLALPNTPRLVTIHLATV